MNTTRKIKIAEGTSRFSKRWTPVETEWADFLKKLSVTTRTRETMAQYLALPKDTQDNIKDVGGFVAGTLKENRRSKTNVISRSMVTLDADDVKIDLINKTEMEFDCACAVYGTHKYTPEKPRLRLIIPLSRDVTPEEYEAVSRYVAKTLGMTQFDSTTFDPCRLMYWPSTPSDIEYYFDSADGDFMDPDTVLAEYTD